jgi:hypothetical protein
MTLTNLTQEEKKERMKLYKKEYAKQYYHLIKEQEPEVYRDRLNKDRDRALARYYKKKEEEAKTVKPQKERKIKINMAELTK